MKSFSEWREQLEQPGMQDPGMDMAQFPVKPWKAQKDEVIKHWSGLPSGMPMSELRAVPTNHKGPTLRFDGLRITGSPAFIDSILSRLKDILNYEGGQTRLQVIYKQQIDNKSQQPVPESYVLYLQVKERESAPKIEKPHVGGKHDTPATPKKTGPAQSLDLQ